MPLLTILLLLLPALLNAQHPAPVANRVLQLDGKDAHVQLPADLFTALDEATVECWVRFEEFNLNSHVFDFGELKHEVYLSHYGNSPNLKFIITDAALSRHRIDVPGAWQAGRWFHFAMVTGKGGARLYLNGVLLADHPFTGSLSGVSGKYNYFGRANITGDPKITRFHGEMDEFRVWKTARSGQQIREGMFRKLTDGEPDLAGLWNFDDGTANEVSPAGHHGQLADGAACVPGALPGGLGDVALPAVLYGQVVEADGKAAPVATVKVEVADLTVVSGETDDNGSYQLAAYAATGTCEVSASLRDLSTRKAGVALHPGERQELKLTVEAENGRIGLSRLTESIPALILLDLMMPEMDGFGFMQELRNRKDCRNVPVIVITAKDLTEDDRRRLNGAVARILKKGATSTDNLLAEIRSLIAVP